MTGVILRVETHRDKGLAYSLLMNPAFVRGAPSSKMKNRPGAGLLSATYQLQGTHRLMSALRRCPLLRNGFRIFRRGGHTLIERAISYHFSQKGCMYMRTPQVHVVIHATPCRAVPCRAGNSLGTGRNYRIAPNFRGA